MNKVPFTLSIHLSGGQTIVLPCTTFEIVPASVAYDEDGNRVETPMHFNYSPVDEWRQTIGFLDFGSVTAIEVERSPEMVAVENQRREEQDGSPFQTVASTV